jgi:hypothetical protein
MRDGYLLIETSPAHPGLIRVHARETAPAAPEDNIRFVARFSDLDAALMHLHEALRRKLIDVDDRVYRADVRDAIAAADAIELPHRRLFADPNPDRDPALAADIAERHLRHRRWYRVFDAVGILGLLLLAALTLLGW